MEEIIGSLINFVSGFTALLLRKLVLISFGEILNKGTRFFILIERGILPGVL